MISLEQGKKLVQFARQAVVAKFEDNAFDITGFDEPAGVFVTIHTFPDNQLRGCIGFPEPVFALRKALVEAAQAAAFSDPRFPQLEKEELDKIIFEVSVLTEPQLIRAGKPEDYLKEIKVGRDGLIIERSHFKGLLLPQVALEWNWNVQEFIEQTCMKAGLPPDSWKDIDSVSIYRFQAQIFKENKPKGEVIEEKIIL